MSLFKESPEDQSLVKMMTGIPNFKPKGYGKYIFGKEKLTAERYDCKLCLYYKKGTTGCSQNRYPYAGQRIIAGTASRSEALKEIAYETNVKSLKKRLYKYIRESGNDHMNYLNSKHRIAFTEATRKLNKNDYALMSAVYLLTADFKLWTAAKRYTNRNKIEFNKIQLKNSSEESYTLLCAAKDLYLGTKHITAKDLADTDLIPPKMFGLICNAMAIRRFGLGAINFTMERKICNA